jgi:pyruvate,water dikinase
MTESILSFDQLTMAKVASVGGKNASLGEMIQNLSSSGINVPGGFALTVNAYEEFLNSNKLLPKLKQLLEQLNTKTLENLDSIGKNCRDIILNSELPITSNESIAKAYEQLLQKYGSDITVAVRSSATAEDSPNASFAGQHDSFLNIKGIDNLLLAVKKCYASLFNDRAIKYRIDNGFQHLQVGLSVGVQVMVRSDKGSAGVAFTIEPENGNKNLIYITGAWGLGESVVQGAVNTDEFYFFKPSIANGKNGLIFKQLGTKQQMMIYGADNSKNTVWQETPSNLRDQFVLNDTEVNLLAKWCNSIEKHYGMPMDIEWAKDGITGQLFIVQARPETVQAKEKRVTLKEYKLKSKAKPILTGKSVGHSIISGKVRIVKSLLDSDKVQEGEIIVADITNPDWNALLKRAICIVTNKGGRTSHASIIARELGIPAVVGTLQATEKLSDGMMITVSCAGGDEGAVYDGKLEWIETETPIENLSRTTTKPMFILADPQKALMYSSYPNEGVGLLRMEFIINNSVSIHPMALVNYNQLPDDNDKKQINALTRHYADKKLFFIDKLAESVALVAAAFYPKEVIVRMSDFKTNEYAKLLGGKLYEPQEENPMLGFRGASRYYHKHYREGFGLECAAIKKVREEMGLENMKVMIPFCRTVEEGQRVLDTMAEFGLKRGEHSLEVYVMAEIPSNILLATKFAELFDGFSIGSNDLTQLTLGLDRDSATVSDLFDENNEAVTLLIKHLIQVAHRHHVKVGLCGQAPSDHPDFAKFLVNSGIDSVSFNPDAMIKGIQNIARAEKELLVKNKLVKPELYS